jgi:hypothetical protein
VDEHPGDLRRRICQGRVARRDRPALVRFLHLLDVGNEAIAAARHCLDVLRRSLFVTERLPECEDVMRQIAFFNVAVGPDELQELILM